MTLQANKPSNSNKEEIQSIIEKAIRVGKRHRVIGKVVQSFVDKYSITIFFYY